MTRALVVALVVSSVACSPPSQGGTGGGSAAGGGSASGGGKATTGGGGGSVTGGGGGAASTGGGGGPTGGGGGGTATGGGGGTASARGTLITPALVFTPKAVASADGAFHVVYTTQTPNKTIYGRCPGNCADAAAWSLVTLAAPTSGFTGASRVAVGTDLRVHAVWQVGSDHFYATCPGGCEQGTSWQVAQLPPLACDSDYMNSNLVVDPQGRLSFVSSDFNESRFCVSTCAGNCTTGSNWQSGQVASAASGRSVFAMAGSGTTLHLAWDDQVDGIRYATCAGNCAQASSWQVAQVAFTHGKSPLAIAVASDGRVALTYNQAVTPDSTPANVKANDGRLLVWECTSNCGVNTSWQGVFLGDPDEGLDGVSVATSQRGAVVVTARSDLRVHGCSGSCTDSANWRSGVLESAQERTGLLPDPYSLGGCFVDGAPVRALSATWGPENPVVALGGDGSLLVHSMTRGLRQCGVNTSVVAFPGYGELLWVGP